MSESGRPTCATCGEPAPYGDARNQWIDWHRSRTHRIAFAVGAHRRYGVYVARHKWFVFRAGLKTRAPLWRLLIHDWSKMAPAEWGPYVRQFYMGGAAHDEFDRAWLHHQHHNPHHWQHWVLREDDGGTVALAMPVPLVREMVADWMGAGRAITGKWDTLSWYEKNRHKMVLHDLTRALVEKLLGHAASLDLPNPPPSATDGAP